MPTEPRSDRRNLPENVRLAHEVLERHYREPVMTPGQFCEKLSAYVRALAKEGTDGPFNAEAAEALRKHGQSIIAFAAKSSLLGRLLYGGEDVRKRRCPAHSDWREIAEWDWVWLGQGDRLHAVASLTNDADEDWLGIGATECGREGEMQIPGIFSRMSAKRCERCCAQTGMPQGDQSPKNIDECRPIVEARIASLKEVSR